MFTYHVVKFFSADGHIAILGNGNQDSQSWFHSQVKSLVRNASVRAYFTDLGLFTFFPGIKHPNGKLLDCIPLNFWQV